MTSPVRELRPVPPGERPEEGEPRPRRRGIYLLPNLFTTAALFSGFYAIVAAMHGRFEAAAIAVYAAMVLDGLDGRIARLTHSQSDFGAQYDSLADMVSFGVAPALVMYEWTLSGLGRLGWLAAFLYTAGAALRLARFNAQLAVADRRFFRGLPSPSAAAVVAGMVWVGDAWVFPREAIALPALGVTLASGLLMVSNFRYHSFKEIDLKGRVPFLTAVALVLAFAVIQVDPPLVLFAGFLLYALSGPVVTLAGRARRRSRG